MDKHGTRDSSIDDSARGFKMKGIVSGPLTVVGVIAMALYGYVPAAVAETTYIYEPPPNPHDLIYGHTDNLGTPINPKPKLPPGWPGRDKRKKPVQCEDGHILPLYCKHLTITLPECICDSQE